MFMGYATARLVAARKIVSDLACLRLPISSVCSVASKLIGSLALPDLASIMWPTRANRNVPMPSHKNTITHTQCVKDMGHC